jgi:hypothetical protein
MKLQVSICPSVAVPDVPRVSIHVEMELQDAHVREPAQLQKRLAQLVQAVQAHLAGERERLAAPAEPGPPGVGPPRELLPAEPPPGYRPYPASSAQAGAGGPGGSAPQLLRLATPSQVEAIVRLANKRRLDLQQLLLARCKVARPEDLTRHQASAVIRLLRSRHDPGSTDFFADEEEAGPPQ